MTKILKALNFKNQRLAFLKFRRSVSLTLQVVLIGLFGVRDINSKTLGYVTRIALEPRQAMPSEPSMVSTLDFATPPFSITWRNDSEMFSVYSDYGNVITILTASGKVFSALKRTGDFFVGNGIAFVGNFFLATRPRSAEESDTAFSVWDIQSSTVTRDVPGPYPGKGRRFNWARYIVASPDQGHVAIVIGPTENPIVEIFSTSSWELEHTIITASVIQKGAAGVSDIVYSQDGSKLIISSDRGVSTFDTSHQYELISSTLVYDGEKDGCCISRINQTNDSGYLLVASSSIRPMNCLLGCTDQRNCCKETLIGRRLQAFNVTTLSPVLLPFLETEPVWDVSSRRGDDTLAFITSSKLYVHNLQTGREVTRPVQGVSARFSPDGRLLAFSDHNTIRLSREP